MSWFRQHWLALVVLVAIVASFFIGQHDSEVQRDQTRDDTVTLCVLSSSARALLTAYQRRTGEARASTGDYAIADDYFAFARGQAANLAISSYLDNPNEATRVVKVHTPNGDMFQLTEHSQALVDRGCELALRD